VKACLTAPVDSRSEASNKATHHHVRSMNSRPHHDHVHSDWEAESHVKNASKENGIIDPIRQFSNKIKKKRHSKKYISKNKPEFSSKNTEETKPVTDEGDFKSDNTEVMEGFDVNTKSENIRGKENKIERGSRGRYRRYVSETGIYAIPGLHPDYTQPNSGISIKNLWRRNRGDRFQKLARISKHEGDIQSSLYEPYHHVSFEDVKEGFPVFNSNEHEVHTFPTGDIYMQQGGESSEERNSDYDYVDKDENVYEEDENVSSEPEHFHGPAEYFETFQTSRVVPNEKFVDYGGELSEAESIALAKPSEQEEDQDGGNEYNDDKVIQELGPTEEEDHKARAATARMLDTYYAEAYKQDINNEGEGFEGEKRVTGKYKTGIKKEISNTKKAEGRNRTYNDKVRSKIAHHINGNLDSSILTAKAEKVTNDNNILNNEYDDNIYVTAEEDEITRSSHKVKESFREDHDKNIPSIAEEYYQDDSQVSRTRRQGKENYKKMNQINDFQSIEDYDQDSHYRSENHDTSSHKEISSASQGYTRLSKDRARKPSHKVTYSKSNEDDNSSDTRKNHSKQKSKISITQNSSEKRDKDSNEDVESESESSKQSQQYNAKLKVYKQKTNHNTNNSEHDEYNTNDDSHEQIDSAELIEDDSEEKIMKTYSRSRKYEKAAYHSQQNISNNKNVDEVSETAATIEGNNSIQSINPSNRNKSSRRALSKTHKTKAATRQTATQKHVSFEEQSREKSDIKYKKNHSSKTQVTSNESKEEPEIYEEQEDKTEGNRKANKSKQKKQVMMKISTSDKEPRHRVRRDLPSQLLILETASEKRHKWNESENEISQKEGNVAERVADPIIAKLQIKSQNVKENKQLQTVYRNVSAAEVIKSHVHIQHDNSIKSSEGYKQKNANISLKEYEGINDDEYEKMNTSSQHKVDNTLLDEYPYEEEGKNQKYWKSHSDGLLEYFMDPEQLKHEDDTKQEIGSSLMFEPSNVSGTVVDAPQHQYDTRMANSVKEGVRGDVQESPMDISIGETTLLAKSMTDLMDTNSESIHGMTQRTKAKSSEKITRHVDGIQNIHKNQDQELNMKLYQEELKSEPAVIRLPKAIVTHINLQNVPGKVTSGGNNYKQDSLSNKEKHNKTKDKRIKNDEETGMTVVWDMGIPVNMVQGLHADESELLLEKGKISKAQHRDTLIPHTPSVTFGKSNEEVTTSEPGESGVSKRPQMTRWNQNPEMLRSEDAWLHSSEEQEVGEENLSEEAQHGRERGKLPYEKSKQRHEIENVQLSLGAGHQRPETSSQQDEQEVVSNLSEKIVGNIAAIHSLAADMASKQNPSLESNVESYNSNSDSSNATTTESSESRAGIIEKTFPVIDDIRGNIHSITDRIGTTVMNTEYIKENTNEETLKSLRSVHDQVKKAEDKIFKITHNMMSSKRAGQPSGDGNPDNNGLVQSVNIVPTELKTKDGAEQVRPVHGVEEGFKNIQKFMDINLTLSSNENGNDGTLGKLEDFPTNDVADDENVANSLIRNAKDIGHLKHITANVLGNANDDIKLQLSTLVKKDHIKAELEKKRLERLHALTAQRAKLKEELLKIKVMATDGKVKLAHHIKRRDTSHIEDHINSLIPNIEAKDSNAPVSIQNEDRKDFSNKDNPSTESQDFKETDSDSNSYSKESKGKYVSQDRYRWLEQMSLPVSMTTNLRDIPVPAFDGQQVYEILGYSESEILPINYFSDSEFVYQPKHEGQSLAVQSGILNSGVIPFFTLYDTEPIIMYAESLFPEGYNEEANSDMGSDSQKSSLNSSPDKRDESLEDNYVEIKQLSLPLFIPRLVLDKDPMTVQFQNIPKSENDIRFFLNSETDENDDNDRDLKRKKRYTSPVLHIAGSNSPYPFINLGVTDDASLSENWQQHKTGNTQASSIPVTEETDPNQQALMQVDFLPEKINEGDACGEKEKGKSKKVDEAKHEDKKAGKKNSKSSYKLIHNDHSAVPDNKLDAVEPSPLRKLKTTKNIHKSSGISKSSTIDDKHAHIFIHQPLIQDLDRDSELTPGSDNTHTVSIRSKRALFYPFNDKFNEDLLKPLTMTSKDNTRVEDNMNNKYWLQNFFNNISDSLGKKPKNGELNNNMYHNVMKPVNNELVISDVVSRRNMLPGMETFKYNSDSIPTNSLYVTDIKLVTDNQSKDLKHSSDESREVNQTYLEGLGNSLNDITNVEVGNDTGNKSKTKDVLSETLNDVNLQTNEINRQLRTSDSFVKFKHDNSINKAVNEENNVEMKEIPYELHKYVLNCNYQPSYSKIRKYLYPHKYKPLAARSNELHSTEYLSAVKKSGNRSSPDETSVVSKEVFGITLQEFPNINSKSTEISQTKISHNTATNAEEIPKTTMEYKGISEVTISDNSLTSTHTDYFIEPDVKKLGKESFLISQTNPQDKLNYFFRSKKNAATLGQKVVDVDILSNTEEDVEHSGIVDRDTEHIDISNGQEESGNIQKEKKPTSTTGHIHRFIKNVSDQVIRLFHIISPWNYFNR
jgi:hypothetical protein